MHKKQFILLYHLRASWHIIICGGGLQIIYAEYKYNNNHLYGEQRTVSLHYNELSVDGTLNERIDYIMLL